LEEALRGAVSMQIVDSFYFRLENLLLEKVEKALAERKNLIGLARKENIHRVLTS